MSSDHYQQLHADALVVDGTCPLLSDHHYLDWYQDGGVDIVTPTVGAYNTADQSLKAVGGWLRRISSRDDLVLVESGSDARAAKIAGVTGVVFHFQGTGPIEDDLRHVDAFKKLGVGIMQLCYNTENNVGYGAEVERDNGLKPFGRDFVARCNDAGVIVDCSHTGHRTSMEAVAASTAPVILSHANPHAIHQTKSDRNVTDELIAAIAGTGGIIGITGFPGFLVTEGQPTMDHFLTQLDHLVAVAGIDHVGLSIDYFVGQHHTMPEAEAMALYQRLISEGVWHEADYPPPPHKYPMGIETPRSLPNLTKALLERGYSDDDTRKILGMNWVSLYDRCWG
jgi:membrane dipeptidase